MNSLIKTVGQDLFSEFPGKSDADWKDRIVKDLKGIPYESLTRQSEEGVSVFPFYTQQSFLETLSLVDHNGWDVTETICVDDEQDANRCSLTALTEGASALLFKVNSIPDFTKLLDGISLEHIEISFECTGMEAMEIAMRSEGGVPQAWKNYLKSKQLDADKVRAYWLSDPINKMAAGGSDFICKDGHPLRTSSKSNSSNPQLIAAELYHNAGASVVTELACALSHGVEYLQFAHTNNLDLKFPFRFHFAIGSVFFTEIAKLRAFRLLWKNVAEDFGGTPQIHIHCSSSKINHATKAPYNNLLRTCTEGMSAVFGGCNSLFMHSFIEKSESGKRLARNQQLIMKEESYFDKVADPTDGSYFINDLTRKLAEKTWQRFLEIEEGGGFLTQLKEGKIGRMIETEADELKRKFSAGEHILVGVNKYADPSEISNYQDGEKDCKDKLKFQGVRELRLDVNPNH